MLLILYTVCPPVCKGLGWMGLINVCCIGPLCMIIFWTGIVPLLKDIDTWPAAEGVNMVPCPLLFVTTFPFCLKRIWGCSKLFIVIMEEALPLKDPTTWMCPAGPFGKGCWGTCWIKAWGCANGAATPGPAIPSNPPETSCWGKAEAEGMRDGWESKRASWANVCSVISASSNDFWRMSKGWSSPPRSTPSCEVPLSRSSSVNGRLLESWSSAPPASPNSPKLLWSSLSPSLEPPWEENQIICCLDALSKTYSRYPICFQTIPIQHLWECWSILFNCAWKYVFEILVFSHSSRYELVFPW